MKEKNVFLIILGILQLILCAVFGYVVFILYLLLDLADNGKGLAITITLGMTFMILAAIVISIMYFIPKTNKLLLNIINIALYIMATIYIAINFEIVPLIVSIGFLILFTISLILMLKKKNSQEKTEEI